MKIKNKFLPYPVLGNYDSVFPLLDDDAVFMPKPTMDEKEFGFHIELNQRNQDITKLIKDDKAEYLCEVYCKNTFFRQKYTSHTPQFDFKLERKAVSGHVDFEFYVVLKENIKYTNIGFHQDYKGLSFELEKGNILVAFPTASFNARNVDLKLFAVGSFMIFEDSIVDEVGLDMNRKDAIVVQLPHRMYKQYNETIKPNQDFIDIILSSILYSCLVQAICKYDDELHKDMNWADALKARVSEINEKNNKHLKLCPQDSFELAKLILKHPFERLFDTLVTINEKVKYQPNNNQEETGG